MRLYVRHRTEYRFTEPQARLVQLLRLTPGNNAGQSVVSWSIEVDRNARLKSGRDGYGNATTMLYVDGPLEHIALTVEGEVLTEDQAGMIGATPEPLAPLHFLQSSGLTTPDAAIAAFAEALPDGDPLARAHALNEALHARLEVVAPDYRADQRASVRFAEGAADPQGAAHLLIAAARTIGFPARYVAGHLYRADADETHAAHGWAELHVASYGWIGFDPSVGRCPDDRYVRVAIGLDHAQAAPVSGARIGGGGEALAVDVHVGPEPARQD